MYIAFLLSTGILIGAGFVLALQWVLKRDKTKPPTQELRDWKTDDGFVGDVQQISTYSYQLQGCEPPPLPPYPVSVNPMPDWRDR